MKWKPIVHKLLGQKSCHERRAGIESLEPNWNFTRSRPDAVSTLVRFLSVSRGYSAFPDTELIDPIYNKTKWVVYFIYIPDGKLSNAHRFTLNKLRNSQAGLAVICATSNVGDIPKELRLQVDALYWKALSGFDFSAYSLALHEIAARSPNADVFIMNDSVFGPFASVDELWQMMYWDLTGFTASAQVENHIQSYAFLLREWTPVKLQNLHAIFTKNTAFNTYRDTVYGLETRFAAQAARSMSVGSLWYADHIRCNDPSIFAALPLLEAGFPFLKRSLVGRNVGVYGSAAVLEALRARNHPIEDLIPSGLASSTTSVTEKTI